MATTGIRINPQALKRQRLSRVLSRRQVADSASISSQRMWELESGVSPGVRPETVQALAGVLGCSVHDLIEVVDEVSA